MTLQHHILPGCSPTPLANYLKALGILRLVGQQLDSQCRGWWQDEAFHLLTAKSKEELEKFFLEEYEPTPIFNPWGGRSGFYAGSSEATTRLALNEIEVSDALRLKPFNVAVAAIRETIENVGGAKPSTVEERRSFVLAIRRLVRGSSMEWLETVLADVGDKFQGPPIFGTAGNEGSGSYTAAYFSAVVECIVHRLQNAAITGSLWKEGGEEAISWDGSFHYRGTGKSKSLKKKDVKAPFRQFLPEGEGSAWDLLFTFEGALTVQSSVVRRSATGQSKHMSSPFFFAPLGAGSATSSDFDEYVINKGRKNAGRGEQWFPLWSSPSTFAEVSSMFRDGKCSIGRKTASQPLDAALAIASLGVANGIDEFVRYGYLQRNNQATHFAVPLGRYVVNERPASRISLDLVDWAEKIRRAARAKTATSALIVCHRNLANALLAAMTGDEDPMRWQAVLQAAVEVESIQASGTAVEVGPIPLLRPNWIRAIDDGSAEVRLAVALGSAAGRYIKSGWAVDPVRHHWLPLKGDRFPKFNVSEQRLANDPRVVMSGRDFLADCAAIVERRLMEAQCSGQRRLPLVAARRCGIKLKDVGLFISGRVDDRKVSLLSRAMMAVRWDRLKQEHLPDASQAGEAEIPDEAWLMLRLANLSGSLKDGRDIPVEPAIIRLLQSGDATRAIEIAGRRLRSSGIRPPIQSGYADRETARRWAAALVFPLNFGRVQVAAEIIDPSMKGISNV
jgi:CRISPR-associated protein Csx17